ncbi:hypothetical protein DFR86_02850 [Acidianus sulfidivorans JP7]|uniref:Sodium:proton antiporter n=1 Tax=Acidianus sulfidivorans JP7 TaxID=619593 RepID=A0A2U9IKP3_9CREN|nr:hypothetical protein [Acidianus sulfidivorans]AWR96591.1 hypothetical protein DFR86_02850 [Acidianus sulfidivorans JP7]
MNLLIPALIGGFIITTAFITYYLIKKPNFSDTMIFYAIYAAYYMALILIYFNVIELAIITAFLLIIAVVAWRFLKKIKIF